MDSWEAYHLKPVVGAVVLEHEDVIVNWKDVSV